jgi:3-phenylpropionate/trans-cinnamate dioxygenase ferredoxin reductase subunit
MVIAGAGEAGARASVTLREQGWSGPITLIGEEDLPPYERPPLSKTALVGAGDPLPKVILDGARLREFDIAHLSGCSVVAIDRKVSEIICGDGRRIPYHRLLIALGGRPRRLQVPAPEDILYLRTFSDALALRSRLQPASRLVIVGGGYLGLEIAAAAIERGCTVTVVELAPRILNRDVPEPIAETVAARHRTAGVTFRLGATVGRIEPATGGQVAILASGEEIPCDCVIAGVGAIPETRLAAESGLAVENGIKADEYLRTSDPNIFAAGDCCSFPHILYDGRRIRLEAWRNAQDQGSAAAENMLGAEKAYSSVPSFWSDQYEQTLQIVGLPNAGDTTLHRRVNGVGDLYFHLAADGRLVAASGIGPTGKIARDIRLAEMLIERRARPDPSALTSPDVRLKSLLAA